MEYAASVVLGWGRLPSKKGVGGGVLSKGSHGGNSNVAQAAADAAAAAAAAASQWYAAKLDDQTHSTEGCIALVPVDEVPPPQQNGNAAALVTGPPQGGREGWAGGACSVPDWGTARGGGRGGQGGQSVCLIGIQLSCTATAPPQEPLGHLGVAVITNWAQQL